MVVNIYQTISYTYGPDLCLRPYGWRPISQTPMRLRPMAGDLCPKHLCVSDNRTLIDLLISYALHVIPTYDWNSVAFSIQ